MEQFAQSICGDIPSGNLSKTTIRGAVQANAEAFAKIVSGNANVDASTVTQIYDGIPLDKLPDNIPTVAMCKLELIKVLIARETKQVPTDLFEKVKLGSTDIGYMDSRLGTASSSSKNVNTYDQNKYKWTVLHSGSAGVTGQFQHFAPNKVLGLMVERKSRDSIPEPMLLKSMGSVISLDDGQQYGSTNKALGIATYGDFGVCSPMYPDNILSPFSNCRLFATESDSDSGVSPKLGVRCELHSGLTYGEFEIWTDTETVPDADQLRLEVEYELGAAEVLENGDWVRYADYCDKNKSDKQCQISTIPGFVRGARSVKITPVEGVLAMMKQFPVDGFGAFVLFSEKCKGDVCSDFDK
jgi:hypothetical protein